MWDALPVKCLKPWPSEAVTNAMSRPQHKRLITGMVAATVTKAWASLLWHDT